MRQYSVDQVEVSWLGLDFKEGLAQGASITEALNGPGWTNTPTGQGKVTRTYDPDKSGTLTVTVDQTSTLHQLLLSVARADRNPESRTQVDTMKITDTSNGEVMNYQNAYIAVKPAFGRGTEAQTFAWVFNFETYSEEPNTANDVNLVGT